MKHLKNKFTLFLIILLAFVFRIYGLNWDSGHHLHPDERMIIMTVQKITLTSLNPKFFAYGSLPLYLLKGTATLLSPLIHSIATYDHINLFGRFISALADSLLIFLIFKITFTLTQNRRQSLIASVFYATLVFPVQLSHFYAVDTLLNLFIFFTLWRLIIFAKKPRPQNIILVSLGMAAALSTKVSALFLVLPLVISLFSLKKIKTIFINSFLILFFTLLFSFIFQPFAFLDFPTFWTQINQQRAMTGNAFVFPYTLQYVNTLAYLYPLKNIFLWGLGPAFSLLVLLGLFIFIKKPKHIHLPHLIVFLFCLFYFFVVGRFAVKFMRYYLPLYPVFAILASFAAQKLKKLSLIFLLPHLFYLLAFLSIYAKPNTRVQATDWIIQNVPAGSTIAREHWDDGLPLGYHSYQYIDLPLYDPDTDQKWQKINQQLEESDYLIIASNRLYTPLSRLTNCADLPPGHCYTQTTQYYQDLFSGQLNYRKVAEFASYPNFLGITINDQSADESFTVYDHPQVMIFQKQTK